MADERKMRWTDMLHQARRFAEHDPHDAIGRGDEVLRGIDAAVASDPSAAAAYRDLRAQAATLREAFARAYERFQANAAGRAVAYQERIRREMTREPHG